MNSTARDIAIILTSLVVLSTVSTLLIMKFEHLSLLEALYFVIVTISTVGYGDITPVTTEGRVVSLFLIVLGVFSVLAIIPVISSYLIQRGISRTLGIAGIKRLREHAVIFRYNELAEQAVQELKSYGIPFIVIEESADRLRKLQELGIPFVAGDATDERILRKASIDAALGIILTSRDDAENAFVAMAAKGLNPSLIAASRLEKPENAGLLRRAGVDYLVDPREAALNLLVKSVLSPYSAEFLDRMAIFRGISLGQYRIDEASPLAGKSIAQTKLRSRTGASIVAVWKKDKLITSPSGDLTLEAGDVVLILGTKEQLRRAKALIESGRTLLRIKPAKRAAVRDETAQIGARFSRVVFNSALILMLLLTSLVLLPFISRISEVLPGDVSSFVGTLIPVSLWLAVFGLVLKVLEDLRGLLAVPSGLLAARTTRIRGGELKRAALDIACAGLTGVVFAIVAPFISGMPGVKAAVTYLGLAISVLFLYDAGRIIYGHIQVVADLLAEKLGGDTGK